MELQWVLTPCETVFTGVLSAYAHPCAAYIETFTSTAMMQIGRSLPSANWSFTVYGTNQRTRRRTTPFPVARSETHHPQLTEIASNSTQAALHVESAYSHRRIPRSILSSTIPSIFRDGFSKAATDGERFVQAGFIPPSYVTGLMLELHLPDNTLPELRASMHQSLPDLLINLHAAISNASCVGMHRIAVLSIHGRYRNSSMLSRADNEVIVVFQILPTRVGGPDPSKVLDILRKNLQSTNSTLFVWEHGHLLKTGSITLSLSRLAKLWHAEEDHTRLSGLVMPIGIAAFFTGILIWIVAW